jgi:hypothetical protein
MFKTNFKLYLKTLLASIKYALIVFALMAGGGILLKELFAELPVPVSNALIIGFSPFVAFLISLKVRLSDEDLFDDYVKATKNQKLTLWQDFNHLLHSKHFHLELLAFATYMLAGFLFLATVLGWLVFSPVLFQLAFTFLLMFLIPNILSWIIVHAVYRKKM